MSKIKTYFLAHGSDQLLCEPENSDPEEKRLMIGAFVPMDDGNYYKNVIVGFIGEGERQYTLGFASWWDWCKNAIERGEILIDEEFPFDPNEVHIVTTNLDLGG